MFLVLSLENMLKFDYFVNHFKSRSPTFLVKDKTLRIRKYIIQGCFGNIIRKESNPFQTDANLLAFIS